MFHFIARREVLSLTDLLGGGGWIVGMLQLRVPTFGFAVPAKLAWFESLFTPFCLIVIQVTLNSSKVRLRAHCLDHFVDHFSICMISRQTGRVHDVAIFFQLIMGPLPKSKFADTSAG